jgi:hypothetical protein
MKLINQIREFYGFPQSMLAQYVGVSRGHLSMAAIGRKDLQTAAFLKLSKFALATNNGWEPELENLRVNHHSFLRDKEAGFVHHKILETQHRLMGCQRKLHRMQIKYRQAIHALACLAVLQANPEDPDIDQYQVMELSTRKVLDKNSEVAQLDLELRIAGLEATAEFLRQRVAPRENLAAAQPNMEHANRDPVKPVKNFAAVQLDNNSEVIPVDPAPGTERLEADAASLPGRLAVEGSLVAMPPNSEDLQKPGEGMGIAARRTWGKKSEITQCDLELPASGLNNRVVFSRGLHRQHQRRGKTIKTARYFV